VLHRFQLRAAVFLVSAIIALQSLLPLAGELLAQRGWISIEKMQLVCNSKGVKFVKTDPLTTSQNEGHSVKCPWCQLDVPFVLPQAAHTTGLHDFAFKHEVAELASFIAKPRWLKAPARAPPSLG
jgi:hypothetical protein